MLETITITKPYFVLYLLKSIKNIIFVSPFLLIFSCSQNFEPNIESVTASPNPAQSGQRVLLKCIATDDDEGNILKNELLSYEWFASFGDLSLNTGDTTSWIAPATPGNYSVTCKVSDQYNGMDILAINIVVE